MTLAPLLAAPPVIQVHALAALMAFALGCLQFLRAKGDRPHRRLGWVWAGLMAVVAASGFGIHTVQVWGIWSPIHLLSVLTLATLPLALRAARAGRVRAHARAMTLLFAGALLIAGGFTLLPHRIMGQVVFGGG